MPETKTEVREVTKEVPRELTAAERAEIQNNLKKEVVQGAREIFAIGDKYDMRDLAMQFVQDGKGIDEFRAEVLVKLGDAKPVKTDPKIGMKDKEIRQFSFMRALNALAAGKPTDAVEFVERHLGMGAMGQHAALPMEARPGRYLPETMHAIGRQSHRHGSELSAALKAGDRPRIDAALRDVTATCVACHSTYRLY